MVVLRHVDSQVRALDRIKQPLFMFSSREEGSVICGGKDGRQKAGIEGDLEV